MPTTTPPHTPTRNAATTRVTASRAFADPAVADLPADAQPDRRRLTYDPAGPNDPPRAAVIALLAVVPAGAAWALLVLFADPAADVLEAIARFVRTL